MRRLGQHFLSDPRILGRIVDAVEVEPGETVLEIGPGKGSLTEVLRARGAHVIAIEKDSHLAAELEGHGLSVIVGDALKVQWPRVPKIVGNIPYYITSDILLRLFAYYAYFHRIVLMVQKEVAERIAAKPGGKDYGLLSATAQLYARVEKLFAVPPGAFTPAPRVHSAVVRLTIEPQWERLQVPECEFIEFLKLSFGQKRKTLVNNLKPRYDAALAQQALKKAGVRADARSETLTLEKAAAVFRMLRANELS